MFKDKFFFFKRYLFNKKDYDEFSILMSNINSLNHDELRALNFYKRKILVDFSFENNAFYEKKYKQVGYELNGIKSESDFSALPVLEKDEIREFGRDFISSGYDLSSLSASVTGGTTGKPLKTYRSKRDPIVPISWRALSSWGLSPADNSGYLSRVIPSKIGGVMQNLLLWPTKRCWISAMHMTDAEMNIFYQKLIKNKTKYLVGYVGAIDNFASYLERNNLIIDHLEVVWTTASPLPEIKRVKLETIFNCSVYIQYGSCEFYWLATECMKKEGLHISNDVRHIEVLDDFNNPIADSFGDIVATDLTNFAFPLIRYRLGDRGRILSKNCSCGSPLPLLDYVQGRNSDNIYTRSGGIIPGEYWTTIFDAYPNMVRMFQVYQRSDFTVEVRYETDTEMDISDSDKNLIISDIQNKTFSEVRLELILTKIENHSGKFRFVFSELQK
ncbi:phenylacetate--CoA ligase family protein [Vibrio splendidus]|jgi:phenylacetate-CoA ligase